MNGRKPKPTALHLVEGTVNVTRHRSREVEIHPEGEVKRPDFVAGPAIALWDRYAPALIDQGVLSAWDCEMFGMWCCLMAQFQENPSEFPSSKIAQTRALAASFGMLPAERARLKPSGKQPEDPAEQFFVS